MAPVDRDEARGQPYLTGLQPRRFERVQALKVFREYLRGLRAVHALHPSVTVFGSGHLLEGHPHYALARETGTRLADAGFTVMTGGGPGLMEAANRGAHEAGGVSVACSISLPVEEPPNPYVDQLVKFTHFFIRKEILIKTSCGFVAFPGGLGTFDEVFEAATLIHTGKIQGFPIVLLGHDFWDPLVAFLTTQAHAGAMADCTTSHFYVADSPTDAVDHIRDVAVGRFGLSYARGRRHRPPRRPRSRQS